MWGWNSTGQDWGGGGLRLLHLDPILISYQNQPPILTQGWSCLPGLAATEDSDKCKTYLAKKW